MLGTIVYINETKVVIIVIIMMMMVVGREKKLQHYGTTILVMKLSV